MRSMMRSLVVTVVAAIALAIAAPAFAQSTGSATPTFQIGSRQDAATAVVHNKTSATTTTITPPAGQYVYLTGADIVNCAGASAVTAAAPTNITTTGFSGSLTFMIGSGVTAGQCTPSSVPAFNTPLKSAAPGTAVTFVLPTFATNQTIAMNVYYFFAP